MRFLVPSMIEMLIAADALATPSLRLLQYGAAPIHPHTTREVLKKIPQSSCCRLRPDRGSPITFLHPRGTTHCLAGHPELLESVGRAARAWSFASTMSMSGSR